jgi:hypothetical protein
MLGSHSHDDSNGSSFMSIGLPPPRWTALGVLVMVGACRGGAPPSRAVEWKTSTTEAAALLLLDRDGTAKLVCLPGRAQPRQLFGGIALSRILDVGWRAGPMVAGWPVCSADRKPGPDGELDDELVLLAPSTSPRRPAKAVRAARFSPDATALAYEVAESGDGDVATVPPTSYVLELETGKVTELGGLTDPLWEADGKHLRGTLLRAANPERPAPSVPWTSLRARWDRESGTITIDGPGSAQIPAPFGEAVAWSEEQRSRLGPDRCTVFLSRRGGVRHSAVGRPCMGIADDRAVRWSADGTWLAFPHPESVASHGSPARFVVDVVSVQGGRHRALSALYARSHREKVTIATAPGSIWFDWSPSGRFLVLQDGANELRVYDFEAQGTANLGRGERPMWSPGGAYLLVLAAAHGAADSPPNQAARGSAAEAFVLPSAVPSARIGLGPVRDARWLPAQACEE